MRICSKCHVEKSLESFRIYKNRKGTSSYRSECKRCAKEYNRQRYIENREKCIKQSQEYRKRNRKKRREYHRQYCAKRYKEDSNYKMTVALRGRLNQAIKKGYKAGSAIEDLGCSIEELKQYLESKFQPGMTWENWSRDGWHIDHIRSLVSFDLTDREQFLEACHYTNLQPLWSNENISKGGYDG